MTRFKPGTLIQLKKNFRMNTDEIPQNDPMWKPPLILRNIEDNGHYDVILLTGDYSDGWIPARFELYHPPVDLKVKKITI